MINSQINGIFPTPIYRTTLTQDFSKKQLFFINKSKKKRNKGGNSDSCNKNVLDENIFKSIKQELSLIVEDYFEKIISPSDNITPYITQSWLNYTETNQTHHIHNHSNSYISGVLYINCHETLDTIKFYNKEDYNAIQPAVKEYNLYNSDRWWFRVNTKDVIIFPSSLNHGVEPKKGNNTRLSLSFNVFLKGTCGTSYEATELTLK
tara:strand:- start:65 stop:682 length:618 start_codon:yes stop_codon:yes gene_type:complete